MRHLDKMVYEHSKLDPISRNLYVKLNVTTPNSDANHHYDVRFSRISLTKHISRTEINVLRRADKENRLKSL